jgi:hypothetical protein
MVSCYLVFLFMVSVFFCCSVGLMFDLEILSWCNKLRLVFFFFLIVICRIGSVSLLRKWWEVGKMSFL